MTDRELIIKALEMLEYHARRRAWSARTPDIETTNTQEAEECLRVRAELEDNSDYVVKGGAA